MQIPRARAYLFVNWFCKHFDVCSVNVVVSVQSIICSAQAGFDSAGGHLRVLSSVPVGGTQGPGEGPEQQTI